MKADLHSWEFLGIPRNSQKAGNSFRKGKAKMFFTIDMFFYPLDNQHVRSDKNSILWASVYAGNADL